MIEVHRTTQAVPAERLASLPPLAFGPEPDYSQVSVQVDDNHRFQTIEGFGGAFTEAAAVTFYKLSPDNQRQLLRDYFDPNHGHGYTLGRTHINSCDFALGNWAYCETDGDTELNSFSVAHDREAIIPLLKAAAATAGKGLQLFASPWSPPAWMKTTGMMNKGGKLKPEHRAAWALYYAKYLAAYKAEGLDFWGLTIQNEPEATQKWDSCVYTGEEERDFVRDHLGPTLHREGWGHVKVIVWDHNRDRMFERAKVVYDDPEASRYVWGTGFHWYTADCFENVQRVHDAWPDKGLIFTEGCFEHFGGDLAGPWEFGEKYARSVLNDLNHWTAAWCDWNLILDETGGPNHVGNFCSAPIMVDTRVPGGEIVHQSSYYYLGHFSRFIRPGAVRIAAAGTRDELETTAFLNPDGRIAVVVLNRSDKARPFALKYRGQAAMTEAPAHSITTYRFAGAS